MIATTIVDTRHRAWALRAVVEALAATGLWDTAIDTAQTIEFPSIQEWALQEVAEAQAQAGMCIAASATAYTIQDSNLRSQSLRSIAQALTRLGNTEQLRLHAQNSWLQATTSNDVWSLLPLANNFIIASPTLLSELLSSMRWVTDFLHSQPRSAQ